MSAENAAHAAPDITKESMQKSGMESNAALIREAQESRNRLRQMLAETRLLKAASYRLIAELEARLQRSKRIGRSQSRE